MMKMRGFCDAGGGFGEWWSSAMVVEMYNLCDVFSYKVHGVLYFWHGPVPENYLCIQYNVSGTGSFTTRRCYDPALNYAEVYICYNMTPNPNEWARLKTTANRTLGGLN